MVPQKAHRFTHNQAIGERAMIVGTGSTYREECIATACQDSVFAINVAQNYPAIRNFVDRKSSFQIDSKTTCSTLASTLPVMRICAFANVSSITPGEATGSPSPSPC